MEIKILNDQERKKYLSNERLPENKIIAQHGQETRKEMGFLANGSEVVAVPKLNKDILLTYSLIEELKENGFVGPTYYQIVASDEGKQVGRCTYDIMDHGIHMSYIGIDEANGDEYLGMGIGSVMLQKLEEHAAKIHEEFIEGIYCPLGKFKDHSKEFYERHGYELFTDYADHGRSCFFKKLKGQSSLSEEGQEKAQE